MADLNELQDTQKRCKPDILKLKLYEQTDPLRASKIKDLTVVIQTLKLAVKQLEKPTKPPQIRRIKLGGILSGYLDNLS